jgi:hypothetical protein
MYIGLYRFPASGSDQLVFKKKVLQSFFGEFLDFIQEGIYVEQRALEALIPQPFDRVDSANKNGMP